METRPIPDSSGEVVKPVGNEPRLVQIDSGAPECMTCQASAQIIQFAEYVDKTTLKHVVSKAVVGCWCSQECKQIWIDSNATRAKLAMSSLPKNTSVGITITGQPTGPTPIPNGGSLTIAAQSITIGGQGQGPDGSITLSSPAKSGGVVIGGQQSTIGSGSVMPTYSPLSNPGKSMIWTGTGWESK